MAKTTLSKRIGYLDHGYDFDGTLAIADMASLYLVTVGMFPALDKFLDKNPIYRIGPPTYTNVANLAVELLTKRLAGQDSHDPEGNTDFMDLYIEAQTQYPDIVDNPMIVSCETLFINTYYRKKKLKKKSDAHNTDHASMPHRYDRQPSCGNGHKRLSRTSHLLPLPEEP